MRRSKALAKIRAGKPVRMCAMGNFLPGYVRHAARLKFDAIWLDLEHRAMSTREVQSLLVYFRMYDIDCMIRPPTLEKTGLYRYFEDGATGFMIPHVSTPQKARMLVQAVKFPPIGDRGLDGAGQDCDFVHQGGTDYPEQANRETFLIVQIETPEAVENVDEIAAIEGIDGLFIGPADLGLRLHYLPDCDMSVEDAAVKVAAAAKKHGKVWGRPGINAELTKSYIEMGAQLVPLCGDSVVKMLEECSRSFDEILGE